MALWLVRAGKFGEYETKFLEENRIYLTWDQLNDDLSQLNDWEQFKNHLFDLYESSKKKTVINWASQIWPIAHEMKVGDWVVLPSKLNWTIHIAEITGSYQHHPDAENPFYHSRTVKWIQKDIPRDNFDSDLLYSFGAFMTICQIRRNDAEQRLREMASNGWKSSLAKTPVQTEIEEAGTIEAYDVESQAYEQIARFIDRRFKGHEMERLIDGILRAMGYVTRRSPAGADGGIDILAAPEPMGFGHPRLCVQVKSTASPVERQVLDQLLGVMKKVQAEQGLLVSWNGFKSTIEREVPVQFFQVRVWDKKEVIDALLANYDRLDNGLKNDLPLKQIWTLSMEDSK